MDKSRFNVDEGRDYTLDAPAIHNKLEKKQTSRSIKSNDSDNNKKGAEENFNIPAIKSPA
jgi:hypothetical protein